MTGIINRRPMRNPATAVAISGLEGMLIACANSLPATGPGAAPTPTMITAEQVLKWNPDILIIQAPGGDQGKAANSAESVLSALSAVIPAWNDLKAVKNHRKDVDMRTGVGNFYKTFFRYYVSDAEFNQIFQGQWFRSR